MDNRDYLAMNKQPTKSTEIKANELMCGNYVQDNNGTILVVDEPIPLTEQWLIDFGFNYDYITATFKDFSLGHYADGFYFIPTNKIDFRIGQELKHVHQLQSLFYSLTGKELIKK